MEIFGFHLEILTFAQIGATVLIVGIYAVLTSLGEQRADYHSDRHMMLLFSFMFQEHATLRTLTDVVEIRETDITGVRDRLKIFYEDFDVYEKDGTFPSLSGAQSSSIGDNLLAIVAAPLFCILFTIWALDLYKRKTHLARHTEIRKNYFSKMVMMAAGGAGYLFVAAAVFPRVGWLGFGLLVLGGITILAAIVNVAILTFEQQAWKSYWADRMADILAKQDRRKGHDEFNRALLLSNAVDAQPDVPFPGRLGLYTGIYSVVQVLILVINSQLKG